MSKTVSPCVVLRFQNVSVNSPAYFSFSFYSVCCCSCSYLGSGRRRLLVGCPAGSAAATRRRLLGGPAGRAGVPARLRKGCDCVAFARFASSAGQLLPARCRVHTVSVRTVPSDALSSRLFWSRVSQAQQQELREELFVQCAGEAGGTVSET